MTRKIALEEAFTAPSTKAYLEITVKVAPTEEAKTGLIQKLEDFDQRIAAGIDIFVLSQTSPGVQAEKDANVAVRRAREASGSPAPPGDRLNPVLAAPRCLSDPRGSSRPFDGTYRAWRLSEDRSVRS